MSRLYRHQKVRARWGILVFQNLRHWDLVPDSGCIDEGFGGGSGSGGGERYCRICLVEAVHKVTFVLPLSRRMSERILCARRSPTTPTCGVCIASRYACDIRRVLVPASCVMRSSLMLFDLRERRRLYVTLNLLFSSISSVNRSPIRAVRVELLSSTGGNHHSNGLSRKVVESGSPACMVGVLSDGSVLAALTSYRRWGKCFNCCSSRFSWGFSMKDRRWVDLVFQRMTSSTMSFPQEGDVDVALRRCLM